MWTVKINIQLDNFPQNHQYWSNNKFLESFITLEDGLSIIKRFHALTEPLIGTGDDGDISNDDSGGRWECPILDTLSQFTCNWNLEKTWRCPKHNYPRYDLGMRWIQEPHMKTIHTLLTDQVPLLTFQNSCPGMQLWPWQWVEDVTLSYCQNIYSLGRMILFAPLYTSLT